jgi:hypothetical protein
MVAKAEAEIERIEMDYTSPASDVSQANGFIGAVVHRRLENASGQSKK